MKQRVFFFKPLLVRYNSEKPILKKVGVIKFPFLCVITPVFDPAYESLCKLTTELKNQTYGRFIHVMISNGSSPKTRELVCELNRRDLRFIYDETGEEITNSAVEILVNIGKRRNYCLKKYSAERYVFLNADTKLTDNDYFLKLHRAHQDTQRDVLVTLSKIYQGGEELTLPIFPIKLGHIDIMNYSFSRKIAKTFKFPTDYDINYGYGNDYRFFSRISTENNTAVLNFVSGIRDGNNSYKRVSELFDENR